jgi:hypothetical protein
MVPMAEALIIWSSNAGFSCKALGLGFIWQNYFLE